MHFGRVKRRQAGGSSRTAAIRSSLRSWVIWPYRPGSRDRLAAGGRRTRAPRRTARPTTAPAPARTPRTASRPAARPASPPVRAGQRVEQRGPVRPGWSGQVEQGEDPGASWSRIAAAVQPLRRASAQSVRSASASSPAGASPVCPAHQAAGGAGDDLGEQPAAMTGPSLRAGLQAVGHHLRRELGRGRDRERSHRRPAPRGGPARRALGDGRAWQPGQQVGRDPAHLAAASARRLAEQRLVAGAQPGGQPGNERGPVPGSVAGPGRRHEFAASGRVGAARWSSSSRRVRWPAVVQVARSRAPDRRWAAPRPSPGSPCAPARPRADRALAQRVPKLLAAGRAGQQRRQQGVRRRARPGPAAAATRRPVRAGRREQVGQPLPGRETHRGPVVNARRRWRGPVGRLRRHVPGPPGPRGDRRQVQQPDAVGPGCCWSASRAARRRRVGAAAPRGRCRARPRRRVPSRAHASSCPSGRPGPRPAG